MVLIRHMLSKYTLYECFGYILSPVFYRFFNILHNFAHCNISLAKRSSDGSPGNEVCTLCQKYGTNNGYYGKRERNPL